MRKIYKVRTPEGAIDEVSNLSEYCRNLKLHRTVMHAVLNKTAIRTKEGRLQVRHHHKGYRLAE